MRRLNWSKEPVFHAFPIYFDDLKKECQDKLLKFYKVKDPKDMNWDVIPITTLWRD